MTSTSNDRSFPRIRLTGPLDGIFGFESDLLILVGGAITTPERFARFTESLAHLCDDGRIMRFGGVIGDESNIEYLEES